MGAQLFRSTRAGRIFSRRPPSAGKCFRQNYARRAGVSIGKIGLVYRLFPIFRGAGDTLEALLESSPAYGDAREPAMAWYRQVRAADRATPTDVKRDVRTASILKAGRAAFNIGGNQYRVVVRINYPYRVVYVRFIGTHRQYDGIDAQAI